MIVTIIIVVVLLVFGFKYIAPACLRILGLLLDLLMLPLAFFGAFLGFLIEAGVFILLLWLAVKIFGC